MKLWLGIEPIVWLLAGLLIFFTATLFLSEWLFRSDGQFYQTVAGLTSGVSGALLLRITGKSSNHDDKPVEKP